MFLLSAADEYLHSLIHSFPLQMLARNKRHNDHVRDTCPNLALLLAGCGYSFPVSCRISKEMQACSFHRQLFSANVRGSFFLDGTLLLVGCGFLGAAAFPDTSALCGLDSALCGLNYLPASSTSCSLARKVHGCLFKHLNIYSANSNHLFHDFNVA